MTEVIALQNLLKDLHLKGMQMALDTLLDRANRQGMSIQDFLHEMLLQEKKYKQERSIQYRISQAKLPFEWSLDTFPFHLKPSINKTQIMTLSGLEFVERGDNIVFIGEPGTGKTGLSIGLIRKALLEGYRGRFYKVQDLLDELFASLADRSTSKLIKKLTNLDILIMDEFGYLTLKQEQMNMFFKLMDERYSKSKSTIITTNLTYENWYEILSPKSMVDALLDRLLHNCITLNIENGSLRRAQDQASQ